MLSETLGSYKKIKTVDLLNGSGIPSSSKNFTTTLIKK